MRQLVFTVECPLPGPYAAEQVKLASNWVRDDVIQEDSVVFTVQVAVGCRIGWPYGEGPVIEPLSVTLPESGLAGLLAALPLLAWLRRRR